MKTKFFGLLLISLFVGCTQPTKSSDESITTSANAAAHYSFEELHQASHYLATLMIKRINDQHGRKKSTSILNCDPDEFKANMWIMQVKSLLDQKQSEFQQQYLDNQLNHKACVEKCICDGYADVIRSLEPKKIRRHDLLIQSQLDKQHKQLTEKQKLVCAQQFKSFCDSPLHQYLKSLD